MTKKPQILQELEAVIAQMTAAEETIRISKQKIEELLPQFHKSVSDDQRLEVAQYLMEKHKGTFGIHKHSISRGVLDCSWYEMDARLHPKPTCPVCLKTLKHFHREQTVKDYAGLFRPRSIPAGWNCLECADIPWRKYRSLKDSKSLVLRRFSSVPFSLGAYTYAKSGSALIRVDRHVAYVEPEFVENARDAALMLESYLASGDLGYVPLPKIPKQPRQESWKLTYYADNKLLSYGILKMIDGLPGIMIAPRITGPMEPMPFRFAHGAGIVSPLKPKQAGTRPDFFLVDGYWVDRSGAT